MYLSLLNGKIKLTKLNEVIINYYFVSRNVERTETNLVTLYSLKPKWR